MGKNGPSFAVTGGVRKEGGLNQEESSKREVDRFQREK